MQEKLVILGIDGADWKIIDPLLQEGCLPNFSKLIEKKYRLPLPSIYPHLTPPVWTSIFTGVNPGKHGIHDFFHINAGF